MCGVGINGCSQGECADDGWGEYRLCLYRGDGVLEGDGDLVMD